MRVSTPEEKKTLFTNQRRELLSSAGKSGEELVNFIESAIRSESESALVQNHPPGTNLDTADEVDSTEDQSINEANGQDH